MKKLISVLLLLAVLISCCGCQSPTQTDESQPTEGNSSLDAMTPEQLYGHIDQTKPENGVYKIWSEIGVKNMAEHPNGSFELLCNVDMDGAVLQPIGSANLPFTGQIKGGNYTISNFTISGGADGVFGFIAVNKGEIRNLSLDKVTFDVDTAAKSIGALAGINEGKLSRCTVTGDMTIDNAPAGAACGAAAGQSSGEISNCVLNVELTYNASGSATIGGIAGTVNGGKYEFVDTNGKLDIHGDQKVAGLFAGNVENAQFVGCAFVGSANRINGTLFSDMTGNAGNTPCTDCRWRDNDKPQLTEGQQKVRDTVVQRMYDMATVEWTVKEDYRTFSKGYTYYGLPYTSKCCSINRFNYCQDEDGSMSDWFYSQPNLDGYYGAYVGTDCSSSILQAWWTVSNTVDYINTRGIPPYYGFGTLPVGDYKWDIPLSSDNRSYPYIQANDEQTMYESYGAMRKGDIYVYLVDIGGHTRMAAEDAVVVRMQDGLIDPQYSYVICHEQGSSTRDDANKTASNWKTNFKYSFASIYELNAIPVTCEELVTGEMEPAECKLLNGTTGYSGMFTGMVEANYFLDCVTLTITDSQGNVVLDHPMYTTVEMGSDFSSFHHLARSLNMNYDMAGFALALQNVTLKTGEKYSYTVTASLGTGDSFLLLTDGFTLGA